MPPAGRRARPADRWARPGPFGPTAGRLVPRPDRSAGPPSRPDRSARPPSRPDRSAGRRVPTARPTPARHPDGLARTRGASRCRGERCWSRPFDRPGPVGVAPRRLRPVELPGSDGSTDPRRASRSADRPTSPPDRSADRRRVPTAGRRGAASRRLGGQHRVPTDRVGAPNPVPAGLVPPVAETSSQRPRRAARASLTSRGRVPDADAGPGCMLRRVAGDPTTG